MQLEVGFEQMSVQGSFKYIGKRNFLLKINLKESTQLLCTWGTGIDRFLMWPFLKSWFTMLADNMFYWILIFRERLNHVQSRCC